MFALVGGYLVDTTTTCKHTHNTREHVCGRWRTSSIAGNYFQKYLFLLAHQLPSDTREHSVILARLNNRVYRYTVQCTYVWQRSRIPPFFCNGHVCSTAVLQEGGVTQVLAIINRAIACTCRMVAPRASARYTICTFNVVNTYAINVR